MVHIETHTHGYYIYINIYIYIYDIYCVRVNHKTIVILSINSVLLRLGLVEVCAQRLLPMGDDPFPIPLFCMSRLKV